MKVDFTHLLVRPFSVKALIVSLALALYIGFSLFLYFQWVAPSLNGQSNERIAADSSTYMYFAESLRSGRPDPLVIAALSSFPNTLWFPVFLSLVLKSTLAMVAVNYVFFFASLFLLRRSFSFSMGTFLVLLLLNATTTISLLAVNKEIVDLFVLALFIYARRRRRRSVLLLALLLALVNRFEVCCVLLLFMLLESRLNLWRRRRALTLTVLVAAFSVALPLLAARSLKGRFEEASDSNTVAFLDTLEMNYLYGVAVVPKIAENFFAELANVNKWETVYGSADLANTYIVFSNNLATALVFLVLFGKRALTLRSDVFYLAILGSIVMATALVVQPRYFYFVYCLLCLQAALPSRTKRNIKLLPVAARPELRLAPMIDAQSHYSAGALES